MEGHPLLAVAGLSGVTLAGCVQTTGLESGLLALMEILGLAMLPVPLYLVGCERTCRRYPSPVAAVDEHPRRSSQSHCAGSDFPRHLLFIVRVSRRQTGVTSL